jgi:acetyltransferase-like isoleucine patch superfamily enzyme
MIGGGAIVINDIPPYSLAVGCPARVVRRLRDDEAAKLESGTAAAI